MIVVAGAVGDVPRLLDREPVFLDPDEPRRIVRPSPSLNPARKISSVCGADVVAWSEGTGTGGQDADQHGGDGSVNGHDGR